MLTVVQVHLLFRAHHDVMAGFRGSDTARTAAPGGDRGTLGQSAFEDLVPADQPPPAVGEPAVEVPDEPALQLLLARQRQLGDPLLGGGGRLPLVLGAFVAPDVHERRGEEREDLVEHLLVEPQGVVGGRQYVGVDAPGVPDLQGGGVDDVGVAELRVRGDGGLRMPGNVDLRDDGDMPLGGIGDDLADVVLGVVAAVRALVPGEARWPILVRSRQPPVPVSSG